MKAIMASDSEGGIGFNNKLPWNNLDGDLQRFKELTTKKNILMGRKTWNSLPKKPLPNRTNIVVTNTDLSLPKTVIKISDILDIKKYNNDDTWFIGGADLLNLVWPLITEFHLTRTKQNYTCDTFIDLLHLEHKYHQVFKQEYSDNWYEIWQIR